MGGECLGQNPKIVEGFSPRLSLLFGIPAKLFSVPTGLYSRSPWLPWRPDRGGAALEAGPGGAALEAGPGGWGRGWSAVLEAGSDPPPSVDPLLTLFGPFLTVFLTCILRWGPKIHSLAVLSGSQPLSTGSQRFSAVLSRFSAVLSPRGTPRHPFGPPFDPILALLTPFLILWEPCLTHCDLF